MELAGALSEIARRTLVEDFRIDPAEARVLLVEGGSNVAKAYPDALRDSALKQLQQIGVGLARLRVRRWMADGVSVQRCGLDAATGSTPTR